MYLFFAESDFQVQVISFQTCAFITITKKTIWGNKQKQAEPIAIYLVVYCGQV